MHSKQNAEIMKISNCHESLERHGLFRKLRLNWMLYNSNRIYNDSPACKPLYIFGH